VGGERLPAMGAAPGIAPQPAQGLARQSLALPPGGWRRRLLPQLVAGHRPQLLLRGDEWRLGEGVMIEA
jgi:hypothetical protein